jgi:hypothetical protein
MAETKASRPYSINKGIVVLNGGRQATEVKDLP